ncbi:ribonuclease H-like domain-containing protein, partial [Amylocystis lapponica]
MPPKSPFWQLFYSNKTKYQRNNTYLNAWCRGCVLKYVQDNQAADNVNVALGMISEVRSLDELMNLAKTPLDTTAPAGGHVPVVPVKGCRKAMEKHAVGCGFVDPADLTRVKDEVAAVAHTNSENEPPSRHTHPSTQLSQQPTLVSPLQFLPVGSQSSSSSAGDRPLKRARTGNSALSDAPAPWTAAHHDIFASDICRMFVSCGMSWNMANNTEMQLFMEKWIPGSRVPDRRTLSGTYLNRAISDVQDRTRQKVAGKVATGQCDGWKNIAKTSVVTSVMTVEREVYMLRTHDMSGKPKTGDYLLGLVISDIKYMSAKYGVQTIGWCTDDGPDGKKMRRLLRISRPWIITTLCWSHQLNLVVGTYLDIPDVLHAISDALDVVKWFNNHGGALDLFEKEQKLTYPDLSPNRVLSLILPAHLSHAVDMCCRRHRTQLLTYRGQDDDVGKARKILDIVGDTEFWHKLVRIRTHLEPLAIGANVTQAPSTRLDHVLLTLANLFRIYTGRDVEEP